MKSANVLVVVVLLMTVCSGGGEGWDGWLRMQWMVEDER